MFSLVMSSPGGQGMVKRVNITPKRRCSMAITALSIFGAKLKIALTDVHIRVRESLAKHLI